MNRLGQPLVSEQTELRPHAAGPCCSLDDAGAAPPSIFSKAMTKNASKKDTTASQLDDLRFMSPDAESGSISVRLRYTSKLLVAAVIKSASKF